MKGERWTNWQPVKREQVRKKQSVSETGRKEEKGRGMRYVCLRLRGWSSDLFFFLGGGHKGWWASMDRD